MDLTAPVARTVDEKSFRTTLAVAGAAGPLSLLLDAYHQTLAPVAQAKSRMINKIRLFYFFKSSSLNCGFYLVKDRSLPFRNPRSVMRLRQEGFAR